MLALGVVLGDRYRLGAALGQGATAEVYVADDLVTGERVAVKLLRTSDDAFARWSGREAAALGRIDHPGVVRLRAAGNHEGRSYLVLDFVDGQPLSALLAAGPLPPGHAAELVATVADALAHAHAMGVTHRDIKPGNILVEGGGRARLADFGVARLTEVTTATAAGTVIGTAAYLAPEQVRAERVGPAADVYALGLVLLECMTGRRAYPGSFSEAAMARLTRRPAIPDSIPSWLARTVRAMTAMDPTVRPTAATVAVTLRAGPSPDAAGLLPATHAVAPLATAGPRPPAVPLGTGPLAPSGPPPGTAVQPVTAVLPPPITPPQPAPRRRRRGVVAAIAVGSAVGLGAGLAYAVTRSDGSSPPPAPSPTTVAPVTAPTTTPLTVVTTAPPPPTAAVPAASRPTPAPKADDKKKGRG